MVHHVKPTVLIAATMRWFPTARLAMALSETGFTVDAVCPPHHPIGLTSAARQIHSYSGLRIVSSFDQAIAASQPDLIVPGDDLAARHLHQLHQREAERVGAGSPICTLIERSLGAPESFAIVSERAAFMATAREQGVRAPETKMIRDLEHLRSLAVNRFPLVLKADGTSGGEGVRIVESMEEAERAFRKLAAPPLLARAAKRALFNRDSTLVWAALLRRRAVVNVQALAPGREATSAIACWNGRVLASLQFEVIKKANSAGHASVLRLIENRDMSTAADRIAGRLCLSGLHGLDFMIEPDSGNAHLIEINPRSTQIGHFNLGGGRDLAAALFSAVAGQPVNPASKMTAKDTIALFPNEWLRDPASRFLQSSYHDVPWQEARLVRACVRRRHKRVGLYSPEAASNLLRKEIQSGD